MFKLIPGKMIPEVLGNVGKKPATISYPKDKVVMPPHFRGRLLFHPERCIGCKLCMKDCPSNAITITKLADKVFEAEIRLDKCIYCAQCVDSCPKDALEATNAYELAQLERKNLVLTITGQAPVEPPPAPEPPKAEIPTEATPQQAAQPVEATKIEPEAPNAQPSIPPEELRLKLKDAQAVLILGVGSELRADDQAGLAVAEGLKLLAKHKRQPRIKVILAGTAPENFTGAIKAFKPTHLIIIDAADLGLPPGDFKILEPAEICGVTFSTHALPMSVMVNYLKESQEIEVMVIGIQPATLEVNKPVTPKVTQTIKVLIKALTGALSEI